MNLKIEATVPFPPKSGSLQMRSYERKVLDIFSYLLPQRVVAGSHFGWTVRKQDPEWGNITFLERTNLWKELKTKSLDHAKNMILLAVQKLTTAAAWKPHWKAASHTSILTAVSKESQSQPVLRQVFARFSDTVCGRRKVEKHASPGYPIR